MHLGKSDSENGKCGFDIWELEFCHEGGGFQQWKAGCNDLGPWPCKGICNACIIVLLCTNSMTFEVNQSAYV